MYDFFLRHLGARNAQFALAVVYAGMILAVLYCILEPEAQFNYLNL